jgi:hypothetical protein
MEKWAVISEEHRAVPETKTTAAETSMGETETAANKS